MEPTETHHNLGTKLVLPNAQIDLDLHFIISIQSAVCQVVNELLAVEKTPIRTLNRF